MTVHIVTDSSSCLPAELAERHGVTVMPLHVAGTGSEATTAGLGALELTAMYARLMERGGDDGVVAIHLSKELSATWSNAVSAAGIFDGKVKVLDTNSAGMVLGFAAIEAADSAAAGAGLEEVAQVARQTIADCELLLYVHKLDALRRGGRLSTGQSLLTTALATKPIFRLADGKLLLANKTRTQAKAMNKLVDRVREIVMAEAERAYAGMPIPGLVEEGDGIGGEDEPSELQKTQREQGSQEFASPRRVRVAIQESDSEEAAKDMAARIEGMLRALSEEHEDVAEEDRRYDEIPEVDIEVCPMSNEVKVHVGPGALAVAVMLSRR